MKAPEVPVSWGELIDKITILEIKSARLTNETARSNVCYELGLLRAKLHPDMAERSDLCALRASLTRVNALLWEIEERIRDKEMKGDFGAEFVDLARAVYKRNDERAAIKKKIQRIAGFGNRRRKKLSIQG